MNSVERDNMIVEDYLKNRPMIAICREYALSERRIFQILSSRGMRVERKRRRTGDAVSALSKVHLAMGQRLYDFYFVTKGMNRTQAAQRIGVSESALRRMELGAYDLSLFDLQDLAAFMKTTVGDLVDGS